MVIARDEEVRCDANRNLKLFTNNRKHDATVILLAVVPAVRRSTVVTESAEQGAVVLWTSYQNQYKDRGMILEF